MKYGQKYFTAASDDGQVLLAACGPIFCFGPDGTLRWRYNLDSGLNSLACTGDGRLIAASYLKTAFLDGDGNLLRELEKKPNFFFTCTRQGRMAYGVWDGFPVSFDEKGQERWVGSVYGRRAYFCACSPDGQVVAIAHAHMPYDDGQTQQESDDEYVTCLDSKGQERWTRCLGEGEAVNALAVSPAGDIWVGTFYHLHRFHGPKRTEWKMPMGKESGVHALAIAAEGAVAGVQDGRVLRLSLGGPSGGRPSVLWDQKVESCLFEVAYDPVRDETWAAGRQLHCLGPDGTILWQYDLGVPVDSLTCAPGAGIILAAGEDGKVHLIRDRACFAAYYIAGGRLRQVSVAPSTIDALLRRLHHEDPALRRQAAEELGRRKEEEAAEALAHCLEDEEITVREAAANALAAIGTQRAADLLLDALQETSEAEEDAADYRSTLARAVALIGRPYVTDRLFQAMEETISDWVIEGVAEALGLIGGDEVVDRLLEKMKSEDWEFQDWLQRGALLALGRIGGERAVQAILPYLKHRDSDMRAAAAYALDLSRAPRGL